MIYRLGEDKVTIRPSGALSFITKEFPATDPQVVTANDYPPNLLYFYSFARRFVKPNYNYELVGKTQLNGQTIHILKISSTPGSNEIDPDIQYEYIGYDPSNYIIKLWEVYDKTPQPLMKVIVESLVPVANMPESTMKL